MHCNQHLRLNHRIWIVRPEYDKLETMDPSCSLCWGFSVHFGPLVSAKHHLDTSLIRVLLLTIFTSLWPHFNHFLMCTFNLSFVTETSMKLVSWMWKWGSCTRMASSLQICPTERLWNGRLTSYMCSRQICSNCALLSCQYGQISQGTFPAPCWRYTTRN